MISRHHSKIIIEIFSEGPGTLRVHVSNQDEQYSRDSDVPPPSTLPLKLHNNETLRIPGIAYGTGLPGEF